MSLETQTSGTQHSFNKTWKDERSKNYIQVTELNNNESSYQLSEHARRHDLYKVQMSWRDRIEHCTRRWRRQKKQDGLKNWKPITLGVPLLGGFIIVSLGLAVAIELLSRASDSNQGLAFGTTTSNIPLIYTFLYLYFPTVIAVIYSMFWSWVDLDVKRLEPWFQLSRACGASAGDSLLLHYPFDFLAFVPVKAAKRRQWAVFAGGINMMLIFWAITPLQSAIFGTGATFRSTSVNTAITQTLLSVEDQSDALNANFMNAAYSILWLNQTTPAYTTSTFALLPFHTKGSEEDLHLSASQIQGNTILYETELECWPANYTLQLNGYTFDNGKGCQVPEMAFATSEYNVNNYTMQYIGYYGSASVDYQLQNPNCTEEAAHQFLAVWGYNSNSTNVGVFENMTAAFCEPRYFKRNVTATINALDLSYNQTILTSMRQNLSQSEFNFTNFEYLLATGINSDNPASKDYPDTILLEQYPRLIDKGLVWPVTNMVGFALGAQNLPMSSYSDISAIQNAFGSAHQLLFSLAVNTMLTPKNDSISSPGVLSFNGIAIMADRTFAIIVESALGLVTLLACTLLIISIHRPSKLVQDPNNITNIADLIRGSKDLLDRFHNVDLLDDETLGGIISNERFRLSDYNSTGTNDPQLDVVNPTERESESQLDRSRHPKDRDSNYTPIRPRELSLVVAIPFIGILFTAIGVLIYLREKDVMLNGEKRQNIETLLTYKHLGLPRPSDNFLVLQILENYLPTAFATLLEPFWVVLNRLICIFQPFKDLHQGNAAPSKTTQARYTSLPPQLVIWRALKVRHLLLVATCCISLSANILAVALCGLFSEDSIQSSSPSSFQYSLAGRFIGTPVTEFGNTLPNIAYSDHFYVVKTNLTTETPLPPWIAPDYFFLPFQDTAVFNADNLSSFTAVTRGFGADVTCSSITPTSPNTTITFSVSDVSLQFSTSVERHDGSKITCVDLAQANGPNQTTIYQNAPPTGRSALEIVTAMAPLGHGTTIAVTDDGLCNTTLVAGWVRLSASQNTTSTTGTTKARSLTSTFISCVPTLRSALFNVEVSPDGYVISYNQTTAFDQNSSDFMIGNATAIELFTQATQLIGFPAKNLVWHNTTESRDWMNYLLGVAINSSAAVDPQAEVPDLTAVAPVMENLYQRLFAVLLGLNQHVFAPIDSSLTSNEPSIVQGVSTSLQPRIFVSFPMYVVCIVFLALNVIVAVFYYVFRPQKFLPRMPTTIASLVAYMAASRSLIDMSASSDNDDKITYAFGRYIGVDGKAHIGIEKQHLVVPLKIRNPHVKRRPVWDFRKRHEGEVKCWI